MSDNQVNKNHLKEDQIIQTINEHLRSTSRKIMKIDTQSEILTFISETFIEKIKCDFVGISVVEDNELKLKYSAGNIPMHLIFPYPVNQVNPVLMKRGVRSNEDALNQDSPVTQFFEYYNVASWFTIPIVDDNNFLGLCLIGYEKETVLYEQIGESIVELGNYLAIALQIIRKNEIQSKKMVGMELISQNLSIGESVVDLIHKTVNIVAQGTHSKYSAIYLLDEKKKSFKFEPPAYGILENDYQVSYTETDDINELWPYFESVGHQKISVPLVINNKLMGLLHAGKEKDEEFTSHDLDILKMYANYFTAMYDNINLRNKDKEQTRSLELLLQTEQAFVEETITKDSFDGINLMLAEMLKQSVVLYDRYFNPISYYFVPNKRASEKELMEAGQLAKKTAKRSKRPFTINIGEQKYQAIPIHGGTQLYGYLCITLYPDDTDNVLQLAIKVVKNVYALQFTKQKIELDTKEQVKNTFMKNLMVSEIDDLDAVIDYASTFELDLYKPHQVAVLELKVKETDDDLNIVNEKTMANLILEQARQLVSEYDKEIVVSLIDQELIILSDQQYNSESYWNKLFTTINDELDRKDSSQFFVLGVGGIAQQPHEYYLNYQEAKQTINVLNHNTTNTAIGFFNQLGSYIILNEIKDTLQARLFVNKQLKDLYFVSNNSSIDLFETLKVYLNNNGSIKNTSDELFLHRSSLTYRLDKIREIVDLDIDNSAHRFDLLLAYKIYDLLDASIFEDNKR